MGIPHKFKGDRGKSGTWDTSHGMVLGLRSVDAETRYEMEQKGLLDWLYLSGAGWISPTELKRRYPAPEQSFCYPVISKYRVDGIRKGHFVPLELTYWEYKMLVRRTQEWLDHKKM